ncbi:HK97 family phage prohead protease [Chelativorans sp. AA-79]|uniref:HK97 family phage prohead protease n=1 Tax=Chelativorans sp. AA-79 TaxID=3028735 RepID=UPI0023FA14ED|nr:HK97 family phage prohead protease [Chelativorans sp. AA-79]WEX07378.1 HK97 family phage prohead protease [Chelativorans sp. AA-79]
MQREIRGGLPAEIRADEDVVKVSGYAAVFNQAADIGCYFREIIHPGAFRAAITRDDVSFLINHAGLPLARSRSGKGTLMLAEDDHGLKIDSTLDADDPDVMRIVPKMKRGDLDKMSFAFRATRQEWDETGEIPVRHVYELDLFDVSVVTEPAYEGTEIGLRSLEAHREQVRRTLNFHAANARMRMKMNLALRERENG